MEEGKTILPLFLLVAPPRQAATIGEVPHERANIERLGIRRNLGVSFAGVKEVEDVKQHRTGDG